MIIKYNKEEEKMIETILLKLNLAEHVVNGGILRLINNWINTVRECKKGYDLTIEDYINDLDGRYIIEEVMNSLTDSNLKKKIKLAINQADIDFKQILIETNKCVLGSAVANQFPKEKYWWYWGIINNARGELLKDLKDECIFDYFKELGKNGEK